MCDEWYLQVPALAAVDPLRYAAITGMMAGLETLLSDSLRSGWPQRITKTTQFIDITGASFRGARCSRLFTVAVAHVACRLLHVRLEKPELLVDAAGNFGEDIGGICVAGFV